MASSSQLGSVRDDASTSQRKSDVNRPEPQGHVGHSGRRVFIGPMPEKVVSHIERRVREHQPGLPALTLSQLEVAGSEDDDEVAEIVRGHAKRFIHHHKDRFQRSASHEDDWDEDTEHHLAEEMIQKWRDSEWGKTWHKRHRQRRKSDSSTVRSMGIQTSQAQWVGGSFEIGTFLGVNVLHGPSAISLKSPTKELNQPAFDSPSIVLTPVESLPRPNTGAEPTFSAMGIERSTSVQSSIDSQSQLLPSRSPDVQLHRPTSLAASGPSKSNETTLSAKTQGKQRVVRIADGDDAPLKSSPSVRSVPPVPPSVVLGRTESDIDPQTSKGAMRTPVTPTAGQWGDVIMRDRMLVRITYSKNEGLSPKFDESIHRTTCGLQYEDWGEFMVVWRRDCIEIYRDHSMPGRVLLSDSKHLAFVIPLKSSRTTLSLYSFVDLTFCIICPPTSTRLNSNSRSIFNRSREGSNIFIFKHKSRSRSWDWIWRLWRHRGGELPSFIDIFNPRTNSKVKVEIPFRREMDSQELFDMFSRENITTLCLKSLRLVPDWFSLVEREMTLHGKALELCWRRDASLDWVWLEDDAFGKSRPWALMAGLAVAQTSKPPVLEIRLTTHAQTHYHLRDGTEIDEPPSVEGYVERIKPSSQAKQALYLSTRNGLLFFQPVDKAYPPTPPGLALTVQNLDSSTDGLRRREVERGINQVMHANAACDLRNVVTVRRAFQILHPSTHDQKDAANDDPIWIWSQTEETTQDDDDDEGGEAALLHVADRPMVRVRRSFELLLNTGQVLRFETHSKRVAVEWVNRLRLQVVYWKHKHRIDAKEEMELVQGRRPRLTPQIRVCHDEEFPPEAPADMSAPYPAMENLHNWCILQGCNPITKGGKVFVRKGLRGEYKLMQMFLIAGHLVRYRIKPGSCIHTTTRKKINLIDAYVFSGYFASLTLPTGQFRVDKPPAPRRYQDGLETDDREEDMLLMVFYFPHPAQTEAGRTPTAAPMPNVAVPPLSAKRKVLVIRTRSRIERDAWCFALNTEIEKIVRVQREREEKLKETGQLKELHV
ncbi:Pleckstrin homology domain-containing protein [Coprinopsis sp. MPI-PUGE-AT-0042]|nr:Pleckstrin homology domain-containing protein [Coprinopsis sp. MPI-PUGE-AT-0042]